MKPPAKPQKAAPKAVSKAATPSAPSPERWIIVPASPLEHAWRATLVKAGTQAGLRVVDVSRLGELAGQPDVIFVARRLERALARPDAVIACLAPPLDRAPHDVVARGVEPTFAVWEASSLFAGMAALEPPHRRIDAACLEAGGPVEIFPDLVVVPPRAAAPPAVVEDDPHLEAATRALSIYREGRPRPGVVTPWALPLFRYDERARRDMELIGALDTTGRPRILVWGPYFALSAGLWRMNLRLDIDADAADRRLRIDWGGQSAYGSHEFTPGRAGLYEIEMDYLWTASGPAEMRILVMEGSFAGVITVLGVTVSLIDDALPDGADAPAAPADATPAVPAADRPDLVLPTAPKLTDVKKRSKPIF